MATLLASAGSLDAIHDAVTRFYAGTRTALEPEDDAAWRIVRLSDKRTLEGVRIVKAGRRFRFEMEA